MPTTYTNINKPTGTSYSNTNSIGKQQYDQSSISYDDTGVFYDGVDYGAYTNLAKPFSGAIVLAGTATGLLMPPTYSQDTVIGDPYTYISKPN